MSRSHILTNQLFRVAKVFQRLVLIVMQQSGSRTLARISMERMGAKVLAVETLEEAGGVLGKVIPHIIVSDDELHDGTIHDVCDICQSDKRLSHAVVIVHTSHKNPHHLQDLQNTRKVDFVISSENGWTLDFLIRIFNKARSKSAIGRGDNG